jgi:hypothetical protein
MSTTEATESGSDGDEQNSDNPRLLTEYKTIEHELADGGPRLVIGGNLGADRPFGVRLEDDGETLTAGAFAHDGLTGVAATRFADQADRLAEPDVADAVEEHLTALAESYAAGDIEIHDRETRRIIEATDRVERLDPDGRGSYEWRIHFTDPQTDNPHTMELTADNWDSSCPAGVLETRLFTSMRNLGTFQTVSRDSPGRTDRWRAVRRYWERMAADGEDD